MPVRWDAEYDVVVMGMGAAGMVAAKTAADNGAKVVIVESAKRARPSARCGWAALLREPLSLLK